MYFQRNAKSIDELVLPKDILADGRIRAILLPVSTSAKHSAFLPENVENAKYAIQGTGAEFPSSFKSLLSPYNSSSDEDEDQSPRGRRRWNGGQVFLILRQSVNTEKFKFGISRENDVVLEHPNSSAEVCYIHFVHLQLYPDPECDGLKLCNMTLSSIFSAESFSNPEVKKIPPGQGLHLAYGSWRLNIGQGLDFQIKVLPRRNHTSYHDWTLIHRCTSSRLHTRRGDELKARAKITVSKEAVGLEITKETCKTNNTPTRHVLREREAATRGDELKARATTTVSEEAVGLEITKETCKTNNSPTRHVLGKCEAATKDALAIGEYGRGGLRDLITEEDTPFWHSKVTQIFKATRDGLEFAIKLCRHEEVVKSAKLWKNEVEILKKLVRLDHPSIVKLIGYDAEFLGIELEYVGLDLSHFRDRKDMSTFSTEVQDRILVDISKGIECIHNEGIMHLDIKPQNILLGNRRAVLCDFGYSQITRFGTEIKPVNYNGGTPCYIPPEYMVVAKEKQNRGFEGDIFAFGVTMAWVSRVIPLPGKKWIIAKIATDTSAFNAMLEWTNDIESVRKTLPEASLIRAMLERNPNSRITAPQLVQKLTTQQAKRVRQPKVHSSGVAQLQLQTRHHQYN